MDGASESRLLQMPYKMPGCPSSAHYMQLYPNTTLVTYGEEVGLPEGQMGNSEVGHLNLGAGRIVNQELQRINVAIRDESFSKNEVLLAAIRGARSEAKPLHLLGLVSDGGVHSHTSHLKAIVDTCLKEGLTDVYIHAFTDGRDTDPKSGLGYIRDLQQHLNGSTGRIATVSGRYYAMDRDKRWERVRLAYDAMVRGDRPKSHRCPGRHRNILCRRCYRRIYKTNRHRRFGSAAAGYH